MQSAIDSSSGEPSKDPSGFAREENAASGSTVARILPYLLIALAMLTYALITWG